LNSKLHAVCDHVGRPVILLLTEGQASDHGGAAAILDVLPSAHDLIADRGYDSDGYRAALEDKGITPCIPPRKNRKVQHPYDATAYRERRHVENMFGKLKDWRRVATRYDRCADIFMAAITLAATVIFWLK
jgi:putative transposase